MILLIPFQAYKEIAMKLMTARLCLDCDEIHSKPACPKCASSAFSYIFKWLNPAKGSIENVIAMRRAAAEKGALVGSNL